jgi:hypothetical protein
MPPNKPAPWAADFAQFIVNSTNVAYPDLAAHWNSSEWKYRLRQTDVTLAADATVLISTEVSIGPSWDRLEPFDTVTIRLPQGLGPISLAARMQLEQSLIGAVFGRYPAPAPIMSAPVPRPAAEQMNGGDEQHVVMNDADVRLGVEDEQEYVNAPPSAVAPVNVVAKREPDGLPIFVDLYELGNPAGDVIDSVLPEIADFLQLAMTVEQVAALATKNPDVLTFIKDFGDDQDRRELKAMVDKRRAELSVSAAAAARDVPRRRVRAGAN